MTADELTALDREAHSVAARFISPIPLCGGPRRCEGRDVHQIVGDDPEANPAVHAVFSMVTTAVESMSAFQHTDPAFAADAPPLSPTEPALALVRAPRGRLRATMRQHDSADVAVHRGPFVRRRAEAAIAGREIWCASKDRLVPMDAPAVREEAKEEAAAANRGRGGGQCSTARACGAS